MSLRLTTILGRTVQGECTPLRLQTRICISSSVIPQRAFSTTVCRSKSPSRLDGGESYPARLALSARKEKQAEYQKLGSHPPASVAIVGGGITGLSAAYYLAKASPKTHVTIYEASERFGGWLRSVPVKLPDGGEVLFEQGPRTLRPGTTNGIVMLDLIRQLGLEDQLSLVLKTAPSARNRYIYYPDKLVKLPNSLPSAIKAVVTEPLLKGTLGAVLSEPFRKRRDVLKEDESVGLFIARRFSQELAQNVVSAVFHGIYAGDVDKLSAQMILTRMFRYEKEYGSILRGALRPKQEELAEDQETRKLIMGQNKRLVDLMKETSVYTFKKGISQLSDALQAALDAMTNVEMKSLAPVQSVSLIDKKTKIELKSKQQTTSYDFVLSTVLGPTTASFLPPSTAPDLASIHAVTVMVVNLYFPIPKLATSARGFGYLIPKSVPRSQNPEYALGVIFDSDSELAQDSAPGEKVTVMMGGHWWDGRTSFPSKEEGVELALSLLKRHKIITPEAKPDAAWLSLQKDCIPQYEVGYAARMRRAHETLMREMNGRLVLAGNCYGGVGLNDCVRSAKDAASGIYEGHPLTGLEGFAYEEEWVVKDS